MTLRRAALLLALALPGCGQPMEPPGSSPAPSVDDWLRRRILPPLTTQREVEAFLARRLPAVPRIVTPAAWHDYAASLRQQLLERVVLRGVAPRWRARGRVEWLEVRERDGYRLRKLRYEAVPGLWIPALLYEPDRPRGRVPAVLNLTGHDSWGIAAHSEQVRSINQARRGVLAMSVESLGIGLLAGRDNQHGRSNQLDLCGTSGLAPFFLSVQRALEILLAHPHVDPARVGVSGLSGGGSLAILLGALDTRVGLVHPVAGYASLRTRLGNYSTLADSEQTPVDFATLADYTHLTAFMAPRPTLLSYNPGDPVYDPVRVLPPLLDAARPVFALLGVPARLRAHVSTELGAHSYGRDNREAHYRLLAEHFGLRDAPAAEVERSGDILARDELHVPLPRDNATLHSLAASIAAALPRTAQPMVRPARREALAGIVRARREPVEAEAVARLEHEGTSAILWKLRIGSEWTLPAVELLRGSPGRTVVLLADRGRASAAGEVRRFLAAGLRVLAIDPFYFGEASVPTRNHLFALLVSAVGERPLGVQAGQLRSVAAWLHGVRGVGPLTLAAVGRRTSLVALTAGALEPEIVERVELTNADRSLRDVIRDNLAVEDAPELFCFGLLESFDMPQLTELLREGHASRTSS